MTNIQPFCTQSSLVCCFKLHWVAASNLKSKNGGVFFYILATFHSPSRRKNSCQNHLFFLCYFDRLFFSVCLNNDTPNAVTTILNTTKFLWKKETDCIHLGIKILTGHFIFLLWALNLDSSLHKLYTHLIFTMHAIKIRFAFSGFFSTSSGFVLSYSTVADNF